MPFIVASFDTDVVVVVVVRLETDVADDGVVSVVAVDSAVYVFSIIAIRIDAVAVFDGIVVVANYGDVVMLLYSVVAVVRADYVVNIIAALSSIVDSFDVLVNVVNFYVPASVAVVVSAVLVVVVEVEVLVVQTGS